MPVLSTLVARKPGFTYLELLLVLGIIALLLALSILSVRPLLTETNLKAQSQLLVADLATTQLKSMRRETDSAGETGPFGIRFSTNAYTLFQGASYDPNDPDNIVIELPEGITFSSVELVNDVVQFARGSGEVAGYDPLQSQVILTESATGQSTVIQLNQYGVVELFE